MAPSTPSTERSVFNPSTPSTMNSEQITGLINSSQWTELDAQLHRLSNAEFRRVETTIRDSVLTRLTNEKYWEALLHLIIFKRQAFMAGAVAVRHLVKDGTLDFDNSHVRALSSHLQSTAPESRAKIVDIMMPHLANHKQMTGVMDAFGVDDHRSRLALLLKMESPDAYYLIFQHLKWMDDNKALARKCCQHIMKRQNDVAFNMVCLLKAYFDLDDVASRFSLTIEQYELSHIDKSYENFINILEGKKPKL